jgi:hypothetical protein
MQSLALIYAEEAIHLANERSIEHRRAALARRSAGSRSSGLRAAISDLGRRLSVSAEGPVTPTLSGYPYRP